MDGKKRTFLTDGVLCTTNSKYELHRDFESECSEDGTVVHLDPICADLDISNLHYSICPGNQTMPGNTTVLDW
jgi:hypothetical protein